MELDPGTDFFELAQDNLRGHGGLGSLRGDCFPVDVIFRAYDELGAGQAALLARGVGRCLTSDHPDVRSQALAFDRRHPLADGGERVTELAAGDRSLFAGVPDFLSPGSDMEFLLLDTLAARAHAGDGPALACALSCGKSDALLPGRAGPLLGVLLEADPDWVIEHVEAIVRGTPSAGATILIRLQGRYDVAALGRRIAPWCHADQRFVLDIGRMIDDLTAREQILAAFHRGERR